MGRKQAEESGEKAAAATWVQAGKTKARLRQEGRGLEEEVSVEALGSKATGWGDGWSGRGRAGKVLGG